MTFVDDKLIESGEAMLDDRRIEFKEVWVRIDEPENGYYVASFANDKSAGFIIRVGDFLIAMQKDADILNAGLWRREEDWLSVFKIGEQTTLDCTREQFIQRSLPSPWIVRERI